MAEEKKDNNEEKSELNYLVCDSCNGKGFLQNEKCPKCGGMAIAAPFYGRFLYWGKKIDNLNIVVDRAIVTINKAINIILAVIGVFGLFFLIYVAYINNFNEILTIKYWNSPSYDKSIFWFTILTDLYLYYRISMQSGPSKQVVRKIFLKQPELPEFVDWSFVRRQSRSKLVDISLAFDKESIELIETAWQLARALKHAELKRIHLFAMLPSFNDGAVIWGRLGIDPEVFKEKMGRAFRKYSDEKANHTDISHEIYKILMKAYFEAYNGGRKKVSITEIMFALVDVDLLEASEKHDDYIEKILIDFEIDYQKVINVIEWIRLQRQLREGLQRFSAKARYKPKSGMDRAMTAIATPLLNQFSIDLTLQARNGQLFPCIGREKEFEQIFRIIEGSRDGILLTGFSGVGRTTILNGLAQRMAEETVPDVIKDKRLVSISVAHLISGAAPAEAEERLLMVADEVVKSKNIILVIEDLHNLVGAGAGSGGTSLDLGEVFAEMVRKHYFYALATTDPENFTDRIERGSLGEVFQRVQVNELEFNDAIQVIEAKSGPIEYKNNVFFSYASIEASVELSAKYIHDKYLPEKALDILEEVAVKVRKDRGARAVVSREDVAETISSSTGIKVTKVSEDESQKLLNLEDELHKRVMGQEEAVKMVSASLRRSRAELRDEKRPIVNLLFLGPTGVGKTELAKAVAESYFGQEENILRFDMSQFQEKSAIDKLIGGKDEVGVLTEAVRKNPFSLVLFDEVEKAHPDILNLFLQVMDDGRLTDGLGRTIDFTNVILIMTSNAGAQRIQDEIQAELPIEQIKDHLINEELKQVMRPELINRFDGVIVFKPLTQLEVNQIAGLMAKKIVKKLADKEIYLTFTDEAVHELAEAGFDPKFGARPLRRVMQERVDDMLANALLKGEINRRDKVTLMPGGELKVEKAEEI